jgi:hypothetical protein
VVVIRSCCSATMPDDRQLARPQDHADVIVDNEDPEAPAFVRSLARLGGRDPATHP